MVGKMKGIILDFDGVILESVEVKTEAFRTLFSFSREHVDTIVEFHRRNGGLSRFDKFAYIYKNILHEPLTRQRCRTLSDEFSSLVFEKMLTTPFVPGAQEFIEMTSPRIPLYIVSATPETELKEITDERGLTRFFRRIYGAPRKKSDCIRDILSTGRLLPSSVIFVGDAKNDCDAAREAGVRFVGRVRPGEPDTFVSCPEIETKVPDLHGLLVYIGAAS